MPKLIALFLLSFLSSCSMFAVHKQDIEQGNIMTPTAATQLRNGMSKQEVTQLLGAPLVVNTFADHRLNYVHTYKPAYGNGDESVLILTFDNNRLSHIQRAVYPHFSG